MDYKDYETKLNDVIIKCPLEIGIEILVYNVLDDIIKSEDNTSIVDINTLHKNRDERLTTGSGISDIAILSDDFEYRSENGKVYGFVEVKYVNNPLNDSTQTKLQRSEVKHYLYTNGLVWQYFENNATTSTWDICLTKKVLPHTNSSTKISIDQIKFNKLVAKLKTIKWRD